VKVVPLEEEDKVNVPLPAVGSPDPQKRDDPEEIWDLRERKTYQFTSH